MIFQIEVTTANAFLYILCKVYPIGEPLCGCYSQILVPCTQFGFPHMLCCDFFQYLAILISLLCKKVWVERLPPCLFTQWNKGVVTATFGDFNPFSCNWKKDTLSLPQNCSCAWFLIGSIKMWEVGFQSVTCSGGGRHSIVWLCDLKCSCYVGLL